MTSLSGGEGVTGTDEPSLLMRACDLLVRAEQTDGTRTLEVSARGRVAMRLPWTHPFNAASGPRVLELVAAGVKVSSPAMHMSIGMGKMFAHIRTLAASSEEAAVANFHSRDATQRMIDGSWFNPEILAAHEATADDDPYKMVTAAGRILPLPCLRCCISRWPVFSTKSSPRSRC